VNLLHPVLLLAALLLAGCGAHRAAPSPDEHAHLASWIEDRARGLVRDPDELLIPTPSAGYAAAAGWARGGDHDGQRTPPPQLLARTQRAARLNAAFSSGAVVAGREGLVAPRPGLAPYPRREAEQLADAENLDRRTIDRVIGGLAGDEQGWLAASRTVRAARDAAAGARPAPTPK
jgi:hypothetical protein